MVLNNFRRLYLIIEVNQDFKINQVVKVMNRLGVKQEQVTKRIQIDNGSKFI